MSTQDRHPGPFAAQLRRARQLSLASTEAELSDLRAQHQTEDDSSTEERTPPRAGEFANFDQATMDHILSGNQKRISQTMANPEVLLYETLRSPLPDFREGRHLITQRSPSCDLPEEAVEERAPCCKQLLQEMDEMRNEFTKQIELLQREKQEAMRGWQLEAQLRQNEMAAQNAIGNDESRWHRLAAELENCSLAERQMLIAALQAHVHTEVGATLPDTTDTTVDTTTVLHRPWTPPPPQVTSPLRVTPPLRATPPPAKSPWSSPQPTQRQQQEADQNQHRTAALQAQMQTMLQRLEMLNLPMHEVNPQLGRSR